MKTTTVIHRTGAYRTVGDPRIAREDAEEAGYQDIEVHETTPEEENLPFIYVAWDEDY